MNYNNYLLQAELEDIIHLEEETKKTAETQRLLKRRRSSIVDSGSCDS
jgi:hypothetical protein